MVAKPTEKSADDLHERLEAVRELIGIFRLERIVYMLITVISFLALLITAVYILNTGDGGPDGIVKFSLLFGSAGSISFTCARLLKMWSDALQVIIPVVGKESKND
jgi:hypothetical protein